MSSAVPSTTSSTSSTVTISSVGPINSIISTSSTSPISSRPITSHSISLTPSSSSNVSTTSKATATANDNNEHPAHNHASYTGPVHVAPTADDSSHTVRISALGVACALFGNALAMF
ncbi:uncharacterized protein ACHE_80636S [Aspergillus chevalieri]|uniref:Uncharacterized protein n=1 Tax=Aspergillus chevalieri TaxID=182096 RepID=A0A7R7ZTC9_ASPCH|nr:uncharacterized protein ACHE_80636S [Aspergillus chevalieri]BCR92736.1 hypothetical protein ACHE_80636S [Aspergillus chevalieri]